MNMDDPKICKVTQHSRYGLVVYKPACLMTEIVAAVKGAKEITLADINTLKRHGYTVEVHTEPPKSL
jgi:hypothetical protein